MADDEARFRIGDVGERAVVQQGEGNYLYQISLHLRDEADARELLRLLGREATARRYHGPALRRLDPLVLLNRADELAEMRRFLEDPAASVLYVVGLPGIGKSTLIRGALEFRRVEVPVVWIPCKGLDAEQLLADLDAGLGLGQGALLEDGHASVYRRISAVLAALTEPSIVVLDELEALLDEADRFRSEPVAELLASLAEVEHAAKLLVATRRLPQGVSAGRGSVRVLRLQGLSEEGSHELFRLRAGGAAGAPAGAFPEALSRLKGHPMFIELLASALQELPPEPVLSGLLETTDIGAYVTRQVLGQLGEDELAVLRAALVFRKAFPYPALQAVLAAGEAAPGTEAAALKSLVRRSLVEPTGGAEPAYYLHPILRDAVPRTPAGEAAAHAAAARWFLRDGVRPQDAATWDDALHHLRRAAEIERDETYLAPYYDFLLEYSGALSYAGWGRRLVDEFSALRGLVGGEDERYFTACWALGVELWVLGAYDEAIELFRLLSGMLQESLAAYPQDAEWLSGLLVLVHSKLGLSLLEKGEVDEAERLADEMEPRAEAGEDLQYRLRYRELRFGIARKREELEAMMEWARRSFESAEAWDRDEPSARTRDAVAEAHFRLAVSHLRAGGHDEMFGHLLEQLRIKLEIGKLSGVAAGLFNLGALLSAEQPVESAALLITARQIRREVGEVVESWPDEMFGAAMARLVEDSGQWESGRTALGLISESLVPYYQRALGQA